MMFFEIREGAVYHQAIATCLTFLKSALFTTEMDGISVGQQGITCSVSQYSTRRKENIGWEAHKRFVDLHCVLMGREKIQVASTAQSEIGLYHADKDDLEIIGNAMAEVCLQPGFALCLFPNDAHRVRIQINDGIPETVKKAVFKIPVERFEKEMEENHDER